MEKIDPQALIGEVAPDFTLPSAQGNVNMGQAIGPEGLLLNFLHATWCPACVNQLIRLQRRYRDYADAGVDVLVLVSDDPASAEAFQISADPPLPFSILADADLEVGRCYGLIDAEHNLLRPAVVLLDRAGRVRYVQVPDDPHEPVRHDPLMAAIRSLNN